MAQSPLSDQQNEELREAIRHALKAGRFRSIGDISRSCGFARPRLHGFLSGSSGLGIQAAAKVRASLAGHLPPSIASTPIGAEFARTRHVPRAAHGPSEWLSPEEGAALAADLKRTLATKFAGRVSALARAAGMSQPGLARILTLGRGSRASAERLAPFRASSTTSLAVYKPTTDTPTAAISTLIEVSSNGSGATSRSATELVKKWGEEAIAFVLSQVEAEAAHG